MKIGFIGLGRMGAGMADPTPSEQRTIAVDDAVNKLIGAQRIRREVGLMRAVGDP